jgi:Ca2+-binding EF-hand superfamily protein
MSSTEEQRVMANVLTRFDANGDAKITKTEVVSALLLEGLDNSTAVVLCDAIFQDWDQNNDSELSVAELTALVEKWSSYSGDASA